MLLIILTGLITLLLFLNWYFTKNYYYYEQKGIPVYKKNNVYKETYLALTNGVVHAQVILDNYNGIPDKDIYGTYQIRLPFLQIKDPDLLKLILVKDFDHFTDHAGSLIDDDSDPFLGTTLFSLRGKRWHDMRTTLSPAFTGSKMRAMIELMNEVSEQVIEYLEQKIEEIGVDDNGNILETDIGDVCTRLTNDAIASIAFGIKIDSLQNPNNEFFKIGQYVQNLQLWRFLPIIFFPRLCKIFNWNFMPNWIYDFFINTVRDTLETRERENIVRPDMLHLLNEARKGRLIDDESDDKSNSIEGHKINLTLIDIVGQAFFFFFAGYSSVSITICWTLYELALNPDVQNKLYDEIRQALKVFGDKIKYETIAKMKYLDMTVSETLRKWPPVPSTNREVVKPYRLKSKDGEFELEKGMYIAIPVFGLQMDPKYYPNPKKFDPDRFRDTSKIHPCTYLPFGYGPRNCLASRLALLEIKVFLAMILSKFEIVVTEKTEIPPVLKIGAQTLEPTGGFKLGLKRRQS